MKLWRIRGTPILHFCDRIIYRLKNGKKYEYKIQFIFTLSYFDSTTISFNVHFQIMSRDIRLSAGSKIFVKNICINSYFNKTLNVRMSAKMTFSSQLSQCLWNRCLCSWDTFVFPLLFYMSFRFAEVILFVFSCKTEKNVNKLATMWNKSWFKLSDGIKFMNYPTLIQLKLLKNLEVQFYLLERGRQTSKSYFSLFMLFQPEFF